MPGPGPSRVRGRRRVFPTSHHFGPLPLHSSARNHSVNAQIASGRHGQAVGAGRTGGRGGGAPPATGRRTGVRGAGRAAGRPAGRRGGGAAREHVELPWAGARCATTWTCHGLKPGALLRGLALGPRASNRMPLDAGYRTDLAGITPAETYGRSKERSLIKGAESATNTSPGDGSCQQGPGDRP